MTTLPVLAQGRVLRCSVCGSVLYVGSAYVRVVSRDHETVIVVCETCQRTLEHIKKTKGFG